MNQDPSLEYSYHQYAGLVMGMTASIFLLSCNQATSNILKWAGGRTTERTQRPQLMLRTKYHLRRLRCITVRVCTIHSQNIARLCCKLATRQSCEGIGPTTNNKMNQIEIINVMNLPVCLLIILIFNLQVQISSNSSRC